VLQGVPIPNRAKRLLSTRGVPDDLRLPGFLGPTLFTSEIRDGKLRPLSDYFSRRKRLVPEGFVIGTTRETMNPVEETPYSAFTVTRNGWVVLVDLEDFRKKWTVNSSLERYLDSLNLFFEKWCALGFGNEDAETYRTIRRLRNAMTRLDPAAWKSLENYWPQWFEEFETE
jgi:hypothetical protein